jgi:hypothetical protein
MIKTLLSRIILAGLLAGLATGFQRSAWVGFIGYRTDEVKLEPANDSTGPGQLLNQFETFAVICCDRCRVCHESSPEAACDNEWTAQEFYDDGWRYYKGYRYCSNCFLLIINDTNEKD